MSFHVRSTCNDYTGKTEITEIAMGDDSVVFSRRKDTLDVTILSEHAPSASMLTLTPAEAQELLRRLTDMLTPEK